MQIKTSKTIEISEEEIVRILIGYLQDKDIIQNNVPASNVYFRKEDGEVKCTIKEDNE